MLSEVLAKIPECCVQKMPASVRKIIPIRIKSFREFIDRLDKEDAIRVSATVKIDTPQITFGNAHLSVGAIGMFKYGATFTAETTQDGRPIIFEECFGKRLGSSTGFADRANRASWLFRSYLTAIDRLNTIKDGLPHSSLVEIEVIPGLAFDKLTEDEILRIQRGARMANITPFSDTKNTLNYKR